MKILFTGGGSSGHIFPIIAIGRELKRLPSGSDVVLHYIGPKDDVALSLLRQEDFIVHTIAAGKLRRYFSFKNIIDVLFLIPLSLVQSFFLMLFIRPKLVFSKGGTGALPITFWAYLFGQPIFIHESDSVPGLSNKMAGAWAKKIFTSFEKTPGLNPSKVTCVGNPVRKELLEGDNLGAREALGITFAKPVIMFWGGSQGAAPLNDFVLLALGDLVNMYEIIHVCGSQNYQQVRTEADVVLKEDQKAMYHLYESLNELQLKHALFAANIIVSRSGSGSIFEIAAAGKPSVLVPLPSSAADHQSKNAYRYASTGAAIIIEQANLTPNFFIGTLQSVLQQADAMRQAALAFAKPLAARAIAREILEFIQH